MMPLTKFKKKYPGVTHYRDRHGKLRWRYRKKGRAVELGADYGSEQFIQRYQSAVNGTDADGSIAMVRSEFGTMNALIVRFYKLHFPNLVEATRKDYRAVLEPFRELHGHRSVAGLKRRHLLEIKAEMASTPMQCNKLLKRLSQLMDLAIDLEWRRDNPVKGIERFRTSSRGFHSWTEEEISRFEAVHPLGTTAYLAFTLMLFTGASRVDAVQLGPKNIRNGRMEYVRDKTRRNPSGVTVNVPIHAKLREALKAAPKSYTYLETEQGRQRSPDGLGRAMRKWCDKAGLENCSSHGLRKAMCRRIAEAGGTAHEIMSVSGHVSLAEAQRYCSKFGRSNLADAAFEKLDDSLNREQNLANLSVRFAKKENK